MSVYHADTSQSFGASHEHRPVDRAHFIGQQPLVKIVKTAIRSAKTTGHPLGHLLFTGPSGHGKTTLARLIGRDIESRVHQVTAYALTKPSEIISLLNGIGENDILFIDELHRLKPVIEEVLYVAMEDFAVDMLLPDGKPLRLSLNPFTLIGATTKPELLTPPLKNRFVYKLHFAEYTPSEKEKILADHLERLQIHTTPELTKHMCTYVTSVPREIGNLSKQLYDRLNAHYGEKNLMITAQRREQFWRDLQLEQGGINILQQQYLEVLTQFAGRPVGVKTLAVSLGVHEKAIEEDIEPLLLKLGKVEKTEKGRIRIE